MSLKSASVLIVAAGFAFVGLSSYQARYTDVSNEPEHAQWVGRRCAALKGLRAHGFTLDLRRRDVTHEVDITTLPGISGPEITFEIPVPKSSTLVVTSVRKCWNCPFGRISYGIEIPGTPELAPITCLLGPMSWHRRKHGVVRLRDRWSNTEAPWEFFLRWHTDVDCKPYDLVRTICGTRRR